MVSLYLDLDPERFAIPSARTSQVHSLIDEAARNLDQGSLGHDDRVSVRADLERIREFLLSSAAPFQGAKALAVFCSTQGDLFETVALPRAVSGRVVIDSRPYVEPLIAAGSPLDWCVVLVNRRDARFFTGTVEGLQERLDVRDSVHGQHDQGGWSQTRYERSVEKDVDDHLRRVAAILAQHWRRAGFDRLALGGPTEVVPRLEALLGEELTARLVAGRVGADVGSASDGEVRAAIGDLAQHDEEQREHDALEALRSGIGRGGRGVGGPQDTLAALNERRVQTLLLDTGFDGSARRCPSCGLLVADGEDRCPADGSQLAAEAHLREAVVEAALAQDAEVMIVRHHEDLGPHQGIAAVLRF